MKILWITNSPFPEVFNELKLQAPVSVGWVYSAANALLSLHHNLDFAVASIYNGNELMQIKKNGILHYLIPNKVKVELNNQKNDYFWHQIKNEFNPDIIHIHGTEYPHSYAYVRACGSENVVVSIQGLLTVYERFYFGNIKKKDLLKSTTLRDLVRFDTIFSQWRNMRDRSRNEQLLIQNVNHIIGRTSWDRDHVWAINPKSSYHFCNETLRSSFYKKSWSIDNCEKYSIFISQAHYPIKGFHQLVKALPIVLRHYPETKVYVAGHNFFSNRGIRINGFGRYINSLIKKYNVSDRFVFTGLLHEEAMSQRFIDSHLFICPSAIENSPNSVGEAQLLGVPCIASYVGGTADMIDHGKTGLLYRFEETEMLAANICRIFSDDHLAQEISEKSRISAANRHNKEHNASELYTIYSKITSKNNGKSQY